MPKPSTILDWMGIAFVALLGVLLLANLGVIQLRFLAYPVPCSTADKVVGTVILRTEFGFPEPRLICRAYESIRTGVVAKKATVVSVEE
jgi:hypothetical protein